MEEYSRPTDGVDFVDNKTKNYFVEISFQVLSNDKTSLSKLSNYLKFHAISVSFKMCDGKNEISQKEIENESYVTCRGDKQLLNDVSEKVKELNMTSRNMQTIILPDIWFPTKISDLDFCQEVLTEINVHSHPLYPGFNDAEYLIRRNEISNRAKSYQQGEPIPTVEFVDSEVETWGKVFNKMKQYHDKYACRMYNKVFKKLEVDKIYSPLFIPQLQDVSNFMRKMSGYQLRPVAGFLSPRDFLASLAFKVFQCTQYIRHPAVPMHTPEPDCIHELLGHVPMLCDPQFASFSQEIGLASLGASDKNIKELSTFYWFTIEFGLCLENKKLKAHGAGLLSSFGELEHAISDKPKQIPLDSKITPFHPYQDGNYQPIYFVASSFEDAITQVRLFSKSEVLRNFTVTYNEEKQSINVTTPNSL